MRFAEKHKEIIGRWGGLPAVRSNGSFNFFDQGIVLELTTEKEINRIARDGRPDEQFKLIQDVHVTAYHEYRHWLDMTSSIYGLSWLKQLLLINELKAQRSDDFVLNCKQAAMKATAIRLPHYYSRHDSLDNGRPWQALPTVGRAFNLDDKPSEQFPIWFVTFFNSKGDSLVRQPLSMASLLESRAVFAEIEAFSIYAGSRVIPPMHLQTAEVLFNRNLFGRVYSPQLSVYSVAAHWLANNQVQNDVVTAYLIASHLAGFCLDAPSRWLKTLRPSAAFRTLVPEGVELMERSLANEDRSALFFMLAIDKRLTRNEDFRTSIDQLLNEEWQVTLEDLKAESQTESVKILDEITAMSCGGLSKFFTSLQHNLRMKYQGTQSMVRLPEFKLPAVILKDENLFNVFTFNQRGSVLEHNVFDPRPHMERFFRIEDSVRKNGKFTSYGPRCFVEK